MVDFTIYILILIFGSSYSSEKNIKYLYSRDCTDCHKTLIEASIIHNPVEDCTTCHKANGSKHPNSNVKAFDLMESMPTLCYNCHSPFDKKNIHPPIEGGDCIICHSPHSSNYKSLLVDSLDALLCGKCHSISEFENRIIHKPVKEGKCSGCHNPHHSDNSKFLKAEIPQLCFNCHEKTKELLSQTNIHPPFESECLSCHKHHSSKDNSLLSDNLPDLCYNCHVDFKEKYDTIAVKHGPISDKKSCTNCHSPHASSESKFLKSENNKLCLSCHSKVIVSKASKRKIKDIKQILQKKYIHGAILGGTCIDCHNPHYSTNNYLLKNKYTKSSYILASLDNYSLCFDCHDREMLENENSTTTNFRNNSKNLHYLHLIKEKGKNCSSCHNVHASMNEHLIEEETTFGKWQMPMNYKVNSAGGSCFPGCHGEKTYSR